MAVIPPVPKVETFLVQALQSGQASAFATIYDSYAPALFGVLIRLVHDQSKAEDLLQDTFIRVWTNRHRYDASKGRLFTWLLTITRNVALDELKSRKIHYEVTEDYGQYQTTEQTSMAAVDVVTFLSLLEQISPKYRPVVELVYQGYSREEIACKFKLPLGTVKTWYRAALKELKCYFNQDIYHYYS